MAPRSRSRTRESITPHAPRRVGGLKRFCDQRLRIRAMDAPDRVNRRESSSPHRPAAQDAALSRRKHGFESRWGCSVNGQFRGNFWELARREDRVTIRH